MDLEQYIADELAKYKDICFPIKSSPLRQMVMKTQLVSKLHPNPDDEFSIPEIGPSYKIINDYANKLRDYYEGNLTSEEVLEPIIIERMYPEGYMIVNGHHRWGAYLKSGRKRMRVRLVNLTSVSDIVEMLKESRNDKRATFDLDEVVFGTEGEDPLEKRLAFPSNILYKERLRKGIPSLFNHLSVRGYDIWVYSPKLYSTDYIKALFKKYNVKITGAVTGTIKKPFGLKKGMSMDSIFSEKYKETLHIDRTGIIKTYFDTNEYVDLKIDDDCKDWAKGIVGLVDESEKSTK